MNKNKEVFVFDSKRPVEIAFLGGASMAGSGFVEYDNLILKANYK